MERDVDIDKRLFIAIVLFDVRWDDGVKDALSHVGCWVNVPVVLFCSCRAVSWAFGVDGMLRSVPMMHGWKWFGQIDFIME